MICTQQSAILGTNTVFFIKPSHVPAGCKVTYANFVCTLHPTKSETHCVRMTVDADLLDAFQDIHSPAVGIMDTKIHLNSTISDASHGAQYCTCDIKDFFLSSTMPIFQYMCLHCQYVTQEIMDEYNLFEDFFDSKG